MEDKYQFIVITYNHEHCVIDHLDSIKYQIIQFKPSLLVQIDVVDDHSTDLTLNLIKKWKKENAYLFNELKIYQNKQNIGIKLTFIEAAKLISASKFKILAGDDLYSYHNIFDFMDYCENKTIVFSPVIYLYNNNIRLNDWSFINVSKSIIKHNNGSKIDIDKVAFNAPGSFVSKSILQLEDCLDNIRSFPYDFEDYPLWLYLIEKKFTIHTYRRPVVYYRKHFGTHKKLQKLKLKFLLIEMYKAVGFRIIAFFNFSKDNIPERLDQIKANKHLLEVFVKEN